MSSSWETSFDKFTIFLYIAHRLALDGRYAIVMYIVINKPDTEFDLFLVLIYSHTAVDVIFYLKRQTSICLPPIT